MYKYSDEAEHLIDWGQAYDDSRLEVIEAMWKTIEGICGMENWGFNAESIKDSLNAGSNLAEEIDKFFDKYKDFQATDFSYDLEKVMRLAIGETVNPDYFIRFYRDNIDNYGYTKENNLIRDTTEMCVDLIKEHNLEDKLKKHQERIYQDIKSGIYNKKKRKR